MSWKLLLNLCLFRQGVFVFQKRAYQTRLFWCTHVIDPPLWAGGGLGWKVTKATPEVSSGGKSGGKLSLPKSRLLNTGAGGQLVQTQPPK